MASFNGTPPVSLTTTKPSPVHHHQPPQKFTFNSATKPTSKNASASHSLSPNFPSFSSSLSHPQTQKPKPELGSDFNGRRSTRFVSKMHFNRPKHGPKRHSSVAETALGHLTCADSDATVEAILTNLVFSVSSSEDFLFLLRELGNRGECSKAIRCFEFAVSREKRRTEQGKLVSVMISILGRLGKVDIAREVFETARKDGYGNSVYAFSSLINAYGRSGHCGEALGVFEMMRNSGFKPNLVTYNSVIDACGKGGVEFSRALKVFEEMEREGVKPDRITFNSLLAVCSRGGFWEEAKKCFNEMVFRGIDRDVFTYNTLLDAVCKGGQMELALEIMSDMPSKNVLPNVVTYSTMIDGYFKAGRLEEALNLFQEMKLAGINLDRVSYNTLLSIYARMGLFDDALRVCGEMERAGIKRDAVTYNSLLGGYGKQGKYDVVKHLFKEMKVEAVRPNVLTYSTLIDIYSKGGLLKEALEVFMEFKRVGLKADVVLYSALIDALCKNGLVESAFLLLDEMTGEGIRPNVVTYNCIIDAFGRSNQTQVQNDSYEMGKGPLDSSMIDSSSEIVLAEVSRGMAKENEGIDHLVKMLGPPPLDKRHPVIKNMKGKSHEMLCILALFHKMHEMDIRPNVVTFSAILNACSRCHSFDDASMLLEELRLFDNQVYGVAHGLLMGLRKDIWVQAQSLFDEVRRMDSSTASAFYNALTDMLWHFGQRRGAQLVVMEGKRRQVWENVWCESCLDLHLMSAGAAQAMVHAWLLTIRSVVFEGHELPKLLNILTGWGKHSKVAGDSALRKAIEALLTSIGAPFEVAKFNVGRFISTGAVVGAWLKESRTLKLLILHDERTDPEARLDQLSNLQVLTL
ncbi:hypothetical protein AMTRI_Chr02g220890 [Amborella trichopoda]